MSDRRIFWRMLVVILAVIGVWAGLGFRLASLHLGPNEWYREQMERTRSLNNTLLALRGRIVDRQANTLALSLKMKFVAVDPKVIQESNAEDRVSDFLARILQIDASGVRKAVNAPGTQFVMIRRQVEPDIADRILAQRLPGVIVKDDPRRFYPHGPLLCHVLGFTTTDGVAYGGVESRMDELLRGKDGVQRGMRDEGRRILYDTRTEIPSESGHTVQLTIDLHLQHLVEEALHSAVRENKAKGAWGVVQECKTGRILAMASVPNFDPNEYGTSIGRDTNQVVRYTFEPGSTMKALTFAAVFEEGLATEQEVVHCEDGTWMYRGRALRDYHSYEELTVEDVLKKSSNIGTAKLALRLGEERLESYLRAFGLGSRTGIELPAEEPGLLYPHAKWDKLMVTRIPMGHAVTVTALQMVNAYSTIANGGYCMRPYLIERVLDAQGRVVHTTEPEVMSRPISRETAARVRRMLLRVTEDRGTATRARVEGYQVAGKTGTAEKVVNRRYDKSRNIPSFAGFLPAENPELSILVVVDEPGVYPRTGGWVAAPVFRAIAEQSVRYLHIPPGGFDSETTWNTQVAGSDAREAVMP